MIIRGKMFFLWGVIVYLILNTSYPAAQTGSSIADSGYVRLSFPQDGLKVYLDDHFLGTSPIGILRLPVGEHELRVLNPNRSSWLERDWNKKVNIPPGDTLAIEINFPSYFFITSDPFGATVVVDGKTIGQTPLLFPKEKRNRHQILLKKNGYKDAIISLNHLTDRFLNVSLERQKPFQARLTRKHRSRIVTYSTLALGFLSGTAAVYLKRRADDAYEKYVTAGNPTDMNKYFRNTEKLDKLSGAFYGLFEACFLFYIYQVFNATEE